MEEASEKRKQVLWKQQGRSGVEWRHEGRVRVPIRYEGWSRGVRILGVVTPPVGVDEGGAEFGKEVEEETVGA